MEEKPLAFLSLIEVLEKAVGPNTSYALLEPFPCITLRDGRPAIPSIENAGKIIAQHVGLSSLTFVIRVATSHDPSIAGHIELHNGSPNVLVEISHDTCRYEEAVLETLCHEICHKFLHAHGIRHGIDEVELEYLTDVTAVYLGMGKLMLNGCECQGLHETFRVGYISRECFAFVYRLVCQMRQICPEHFLAGLSPAASEAVAACEQKYEQWFRPEYHTPHGIANLADSLRGEIVDKQTIAAKCDQTRRHLLQEIEVLDGSIRDSHKLLFDAEVDIAQLLKPNDNPHLGYLNCIKTRESVAALTNAAKCKLAEHQRDWDRLRVVAKEMGSEDENDPPQIIECPVDKTKFRLPGGRKHLVVTCPSPSCRYKFTVITAHLSPNPERESKAAHKSRWLQSLKRVLGFSWFPAARHPLGQASSTEVGATPKHRLRSSGTRWSKAWTTAIASASLVLIATLVVGYCFIYVGKANRPRDIQFEAESSNPPQPNPSLDQNSNSQSEVPEHAGLPAMPQVRPQRVVSQRPLEYKSLDSGQRLCDDIGTQGHGTLQVENGTANDATVRLVSSETDQTARWFFVKSHEKATVGLIEPGQYGLRYTTGLDWDDDEEMFRWGAAYSEFDRKLTYVETRDAEGIDYHTMSVTLNPVPHGNATTSAISRERFLKGHRRTRLP